MMEPMVGGIFERGVSFVHNKKCFLFHDKDIKALLCKFNAILQLIQE